MANNDFKGEKILLSSERLIFNATTDDIMLKSKGMTHLTAGDSVRLDIGPLGSTDTNNLFVVNAPRIQFGIATKGRTVEPVVKGKSLEDVVIKKLFIALDHYATAVAAANPDYADVLTVAGDMLRNELNLIVQNLNDIKSDITYTI